jgi:hypothetical protein
MNSKTYSEVLRSNLNPYRERRIAEAIKTLKSEGIYVVNALFAEASYGRDHGFSGTAKASSALALMLMDIENDNN